MAVSRYYSSVARKTTLTGDADANATQMTIATAVGLSSAFPYTMIVDRDTVSEEIIEVTNRSGTTLTVVRGVDGTTAQAHTAGATIEHGVSARDFAEARAHESNTENVHGLGAGSAVVGTTDAQTLTNKTLEFPVLSAGMDANGTRISLLGDPVGAQDAANKQWVETTASAITAGDAAAAAASAAAALVSENNAAASEAAAASSESAAAGSAVAASNSAAAAASALDSFDDRYLGSKASSPATDNDGDPLVTGALYYNTTEGKMYVYDGVTWIPASSASVLSYTLYEFVATGGQTVFSGNDANGVAPADMSSGLTDVYVNGVRLRPGDDFTTTATSVTLNVAASTGDDVLVQAWANFNVANVYTKAEIDAQVGTLAIDLTAHEASIGDVHGVVAGDVVVGGDGISRIRKMTQATYDSLPGGPDANTFYVIVG